MTFDHFSGRKSMKEDEWNLSRFCNVLDTTIPGAASKLLSHFEKEYNPKLLLSFSDRSWSLGTLYYKLGFRLDSITGPNFSYLLDGRRQNKQKFTKQKLVKMGYRQRFIGTSDSFPRVRCDKNMGSRTNEVCKNFTLKLDIRLLYL